MGKLKLKAKHRLLCGDSTNADDVARLMGGEKAAVVATDPPYGINLPTDYKSRKRGHPEIEGRSRLNTKAKTKNYEPVLGDDKPYNPQPILDLDLPTILWGGNWFSSRLPDSGGWLVWDKERPDDLDQATCELAWTNCVKGVRRIKHLWNGMIRKGSDILEHPTQKPVDVIAWSLSFRWIPSGPVYDPFLGSGTTIIAAEQTGRKCYAMELSPAYCDVAVKRWEQATGSKAERVSNGQAQA